MKNNIEKIRAACILANPSILDLEFGCEYQDSKGDILSFVRMSVTHYFGILKRKPSNTLYSCWSDEVKILGRPIRLADVLLAVNLPIKYYTKIPTIDVKLCKLISLWNLLEDFDGQTDETKEFIANLL